VKRESGEISTWLLVSACIIFIVGAFVFASINDSNHRDKCKASGGHVISKTHWHTTYSGGHSHLTSDTDHYCLNSSGGILDIW
jgi:hypothetical protein